MVAKLPPDDAVLLQRFINHRDEDAFDEIVRRHRGMLIALARRVVRDAHDAEDLVQATLLELARDPSQVRGNLPGWLRVVILRKSVRVRRQQARRTKIESAATEGRQLHTSPAADELGSLVRLSIDNLPPYLRVPFELRYRHGLSLQQIAAAVKDTRRSVTARVDQAVAALRRDLRAVGTVTVGLGTAGVSVAGAMNGAATAGFSPPQLNSEVSQPKFLPSRSTPFSTLRWVGECSPLLRIIMLALLAASAAGIVVVAVGPDEVRGAMSGPRTYDHLSAAYSGYVEPSESPAFTALVTNLASDRRTFWRDTNVPLFIWCRENAADWLADESARVSSPGMVRLESIGAYTATSQPTRHAIGFLDLDDGASIPFQIDLLQAVISARLAARDNGLPADGASLQQLDAAVYAGYEAGYSAGSQALAAQAESDLRLSSVSHASTLARYTDGERFRDAVVDATTGSLQKLTRTPALIDEMAAVLARIQKQSTVMRLAFRQGGPAPAIVLDVAHRHTTAGGLAEYLLLLRRPLSGLDHNVIVVVRRQIPPSAERLQLATYAGLSTPARRVAERRLATLSPWPVLSNWCELDHQHYSIALLEPWENRLDPSQMITATSLRQAARMLSYHLGRFHRARHATPQLAPRLSPALTAAVTRRAEAFVTFLDKSYEDLVQDSRTKDAVRTTTKVERLRHSDVRGTLQNSN